MHLRTGIGLPQENAKSTEKISLLRSVRSFAAKNHRGNEAVERFCKKPETREGFRGWIPHEQIEGHSAFTN